MNEVMTDPRKDSAARVCVVVPTYNNCATIGELIPQVRRFVPDIIVVNDGSTDDTADVLAKFGDISVVTHESNRGKGEALASGFGRAIDMGFTHAITLDADGQHLADDIPKFLEAIEMQNDAIVVGTRDLIGGGRPLKSRLLRTNSNFWVWMETGQWVPDTQSGYRAYPLHDIVKLRRKCRKYDFEIEVLVRAIWSSIPVACVPVHVRYGPRSESHFRPLRDFMLVTHLNACLMLQRLLLPAPVRAAVQFDGTREVPLWRRVLVALLQCVVAGCKTPGRFASAIGLGVMMGILPIWGFQIAAAVIVAHHLRLSKPLMVAASNVSFPLMIPVILYASLITGRFVLTDNTSRAGEQAGLTTATIWNYATEYLVGSIILAVLAGLAAFVASLILARVIRRFAGKSQQ